MPGQQPYASTGGNLGRIQAVTMTAEVQGVERWRQLGQIHFLIMAPEALHPGAQTYASNIKLTHPAHQLRRTLLPPPYPEPAQVLHTHLNMSHCLVCKRSCPVPCDPSPSHELVGKSSIPQMRSQLCLVDSPVPFSTILLISTQPAQTSSSFTAGTFG